MNSRLLSIRKIGFSLWDPIGLKNDVGNEGGPPVDEYDEYLLQVVAQLESGANEDTCTRYLINIETHDMRLHRADAAERAARTVQAIVQHLTAATIYGAAPGGPELLKFFGGVPNFGDAEILQLDLRRKGASVLRVHGWVIDDVMPGRVSVPSKHAIVNFALEGVMDVRLQGFSIQNVVGGLILRRAPDRPERRYHLALDPLPSDIEIEIEPCYGLSGLIRARSVSITFVSREPNSQDG